MSLELYVKSDERYVYFMLKTDGFDFKNDTIYIPIDTVEDQGNKFKKGTNLKFNKASDFLITTNGEKNSKILVNAYYDSFYYMYGEKIGMIEKNKEYIKDGQGIFNPMYLCLSREIFQPQQKTTIPFSKYESGMLKYGMANPKYEEFNSVAHFYQSNGNVEIRIPWQLLNVMNPSKKQVMGDLYKNKSFKNINSEGLFAGAAISNKYGNIEGEIQLKKYDW